MKNSTLSDYLIELITNGNLEIFYHSSAWKKLKLSVFKHQHFECQECLKQNILTICDLSQPCHHVNELKDYPELALSEFYYDELGQKKQNLLCLCFNCHNKIHNRFQKSNKFINSEKW